MPKNLWTRDEMILVLNLYLKMPFGKMHKHNPDVVKMAGIIGRTPGSVAMRLGNYASLDENLINRGVIGLPGGRKQCEPYWDEFINNKEALLFESERILAEREGTTIEKKFVEKLKDIPKELKGETKIREVKTRVNQDVFRQMVLCNFNFKCALTGIDFQELLVASHIIPWSKNEAERLNPENGICLSALYDKAFDAGLISFNDNKCIIFSERLQSSVGKDYYVEYFEPIKGKELMATLKYNVNPQFLEWHRDCIFNKV